MRLFIISYLGFTSFCSCTPIEREVAEETIEEVIEYERRGVRATEPYPPYSNWDAPYKTEYRPSHGMMKNPQHDVKRVYSRGNKTRHSLPRNYDRGGHEPTIYTTQGI